MSSFVAWSGYMVKSLLLAQRGVFPKRRKEVFSLAIAFGTAIVASLILFNANVTGLLISTIIGIGLDPMRAQLVTFLLATSGVAFIGALLSRQRGVAMLVASIAFVVSYLLSFVRLELQPAHDPGGTLEVLNGLALLHTSSMMFALAYLCSFIGAASGQTMSDVVLYPLLHLGILLWQRIERSGQLRQPEQSTSHADSRAEYTLRNGMRTWLEVGLMLICLVLASGASALFEFSPDVGIHTLPALASANGLPAHGTIVEDQVVSPSLAGQKKPFLVYLPPSYNTPLGRYRRYPTLYLLHGSPGRDSDWFTGGEANQAADTLITSDKMPEIILVLPDGNGRGGETSEWGNSSDGRQLMENYVAIDLVRYIDRTYRTIAEPAYRGIGGNSMGAFGAMNIAIHHPDVFGFVISLGGYYRADGSIWGTTVVYRQENSPIDVLPHDKQAWHLKMFIGAATHDQPYYGDSIQFVQELDLLHIQHVFDVENGYHEWSVWQTQLYHAFLWLPTILGPAATIGWDASQKATFS
jgi:S-formylglutathione hydrolase FrmB